MEFIKFWIYRVGLRPKRGSRFYSPSRAFSLAMKAIAHPKKK